MGAIDDIAKLLERLPFWKRLAPLPDKVDALEKRVSDLEALLNGKVPPDVCKKCGERAMRLEDSRLVGEKPQRVREDWFCQACKKYSQRFPE